LRLLNASDTRTYVLGFRNGLSFYKVGTDGGFLNAPVILTQLVLAPAQRADLVIDFSQWAGEKLVLENRGGDVLFKGFVPLHRPATANATVTPEPDLVLSDGKGGVADRTDAATTGLVMRFDVESDSYAPSPLSGATALRIPPLAPLLPSQASRVRQLALFKGEDSFGRNTLLLGTLSKGSCLWSDPPTEIVELNTVEVWEIYNATVSGHPIHLHLVEFQVLNRQPFKGTVVPKNHKDHHGRRVKGGKLQNVKLVGKAVTPAPGAAGPEDTVVSLPGQVTRIIAYFDRPGHYVWHCHLLSHEDWDMMRPLEIRVFGEEFTHSKT
jgi:spore coat protein A